MLRWSSLLLLGGALVGLPVLGGERVVPDESFSQSAPSEPSSDPERQRGGQEAPPAPIAAVRVDADGDAVPDRTGDTVSVAGRVTAAPGRLPLPEASVGALQDSTGGLHFVATEETNVERGDSLRVWGVLRHVNGLAQIEVFRQNVVDTPSKVPKPVPLTVPSAATEEYEGRLVRVRGTVTARSTNRGGEYFVLEETQGTDAQLTIYVGNQHVERIQPGRFEAGDETTTVGIVGQYDLSYQIHVRERGDLSPVSTPWAYLHWALAGVGALVLGAGTVVFVLRTAVRRRTRELRESQEALRERESRLRSITENVSDGIYRSTEDGLVYANQALIEMFGYEDLEAFQEADPRMFYADPDRREELIEKEAREGRLDGEEVRYRRRDGSTFTGLLSTRQTKPDDGHKTYFDGAVTDITERRRRQKALRRSKRRYQTLIDNFPDGGVFLFDETLTYQLAGGRGLSTVGLSEEDLIGCTPHDLFPEEIAERQAEHYRQALEGERSTLEESYQGRHYRVQVLPIWNEGEVVGGMAVSQDMTERKRQRETLEERQAKIKALYSAADRLLRASSPDEVGQALVRLVRQTLGYPGVSVRFARGGVLEASHVADRTRTFMPPRPNVPVDGDSAVAEVYRSGQPLAVEDLDTAEVEPRHDYGDLRSVVVAPMGGHGTFAVASPEPRAIGTFDTHLIEVLGTYATVILDRLDQTQALQDERDLLGRVLETSPNAIVRVDRDGTFIEANGQVEEVLGAGREEIVGRTYNDAEWGITALDGSRVPEDELPFVQVISTGEPVQDVEHTIRRPDGRQRILSVSGAPLCSDAGDVVEVVFHLHDITSQRQREWALRERERKIEALYEATGELLRAERRAEVADRLIALVSDTLGHPATTIRWVQDGQLAPSRVPPVVHDRMPERPAYDLDGDTPAAQAYRTGETQVYDDLSAVVDGMDRGDIRATAYVPVGAYGLISVGSSEVGGIDAFDCRLLEVLAAYAALVLERLDRETTLRETKRKAEEASRMKSSFLANMSHEIRTPLTSIIGFAEAIGTDTAAAPRFAPLIEQGGKRLLETLEGVLNLSKLEAGQMELETQPVNLADQARRTADELRSKAAEKGLDLQVDTDERPVWALADEGGVQIVLRNLLSNAIKYTSTGFVRVRVYREDDAAVLDVEDTGIGMEPETAKELFEPFRQASEGMSREYEGTGVGLAVTKKAVEEMGGAIKVHTRKGEGSCFVVCLPDADATVDRDS
ncbi:PAS domain S-box protein [Salinibacter altiplanensis]|uniref:PAS domain S-box protein n=1 Tax=Salinibacter altiplanensis TaxID=1803181 RepID=UPI0018F871CC|nr:PAS domain S-box protein [Salinibacter altiplanensis]